MSESICAKCSLAKLDCCHLRGNPIYKFGMTVSDVVRISTNTGKKPNEFSDLETMNKYIVNEIKQAIPGMERMFPHKLRMSLKFEGENKACHFWKQGIGCTLGRDIRPRTCNIYPAWYKKVDGEFEIDPRALASESSCMALKEGKFDGEAIFNAMGQNIDQLKTAVQLSDIELDDHNSRSMNQILEVYEHGVLQETTK